MKTKFPFQDIFDKWCKNQGIPDYVDPENTMQKELTQKPAIKKLLKIWHDFSDEERLGVKWILFDNYCINCGRHKNRRRCRCNNDE
jgi:hypothetical protein